MIKLHFRPKDFNAEFWKTFFSGSPHGAWGVRIECGEGWGRKASWPPTLGDTDSFTSEDAYCLVRPCSSKFSSVRTPYKTWLTRRYSHQKNKEKGEQTEWSQRRSNKRLSALKLLRLIFYGTFKKHKLLAYCKTKRKSIGWFRLHCINYNWRSLKEQNSIWFVQNQTHNKVLICPIYLVKIYNMNSPNSQLHSQKMQSFFISNYRKIFRLV